MRIYVGGSLEHGPDDHDARKEFVGQLGVEIVRRDHVLLNGCRSSFDVEIARAAHEWLTKNRPSEVMAEEVAGPIISYYLKSEKPAHTYGVVRRSSLESWKMDRPETRVPEQIDTADATIFIAGTAGTLWARNWAYYARKPIFGIPCYGGSGETIYDQELRRLAIRGIHPCRGI